jgi:hypothetical protein
MSHTFKRRMTKPVIILLLLVVAGMTTGCLWAPNLAIVREDLERQIPGVNFDKEIEITLGRLSLTFARLITAFVPDARDAHRYLRDVNRVELAIYNAERVITTNVSMPAKLKRMQEQEGWELAVRVRDSSDLVWLLYRIEDERIKEIFLVVLSDDDLVIVKAQGRLDRLVGYALSESGAMKGLPEKEHTF